MTHLRFFLHSLSLFLLVSGFSLVQGQTDRKAPKLKAKANWFNLDLAQDGVPGVSTERAYEELLKDKTGQEVVVAVIDGGVDTAHEDLRSRLWVNPDEVAGDGIDNDENGYVDDVHGWNFLGNADGKDVHYDNLEVVRLVRELYPRYRSVLPSTPLEEGERRAFQSYLKMNTDYMTRLERAQLSQRFVNEIAARLDSIERQLGKDSLTLTDLSRYKTKDRIERRIISLVKRGIKEEGDYNSFRKDLQDARATYNTQVAYHLNMDYDSRDIVGDNYEDGSERYYGNHDVKGPDASHGTHVAGIIAADRVNGIGIKGVADQARILAVRTVPDGDERDKDVANAIFYAVDQGAKVINMSFGKAYTKDKQIVDSAVRYAMEKDVLLVHASGNESQNNDEMPNYPNRHYADSLSENGEMADAWIEVGATGWKIDKNLVADFSNYGKKSVDVFAPGVDIYSTYPDGKYKEEQGTSMAAPVVSGVAALIRSYYPSLTAAQVKEVILNSVTKVDQKVRIRENKSRKMVSLEDISISGGIVNAFEALKAAQAIAEKKDK